MAKLGEVCLINPKSCTLRDDTEVSFIPMTKVGEHGEFDASEIKNYSEVKKGFTNFQNGDILFAKITPCMENGKGAIAHNMKNGIGFGSTEFHVLRPDTDKMTSEWLYYLTTWKTFRKEAERNMTGSAGQKRVPKTFLENYVVNLPDIDTQKSENKILRKVDDLIFLRKQQLSKLDELVKARFVEMFGNPIENTMNWPKKLLRDITTKIGSGATPKGGRESYPNAGVSLIRSMNVYDGQFLYKDLAHLTDEQATQLNGVTVEAEDILVNITGASVARSCVVPKDVLPARVNQHVAIVRCNRELLNPIFTNKMFINNEFKKALLSIGESGGATRQAITKKQLEELSVVVPPLSIQNEFFTFSECVDQQKQTIQQSLEKLELMKKALMQEYFG